MFEIRTFIGVWLLLLLVVLVITKKLKVTKVKILIIGFLFGVFLMPFVMVMGISLGLLPLNPLTQPGTYFSMLFYQEQPTRYAPALDKTGKPIPFSELGDEAQKFIAENPTMSQATPLSEIVSVITDGIYSAIIFWLAYLILRIFRKKPRSNTEIKS